MELNAQIAWIKTTLLIIIYLNRLYCCREEVFQNLQEKTGRNLLQKSSSEPQNKYVDYLQSNQPLSLYYARVKTEGRRTDRKLERYFSLSENENNFANFTSFDQKLRRRKKENRHSDEVNYFRRRLKKSAVSNSSSTPHRSESVINNQSSIKNVSNRHSDSSDIPTNRLLSFPTQAVYLGSIHKESYQRIINGSLAIIGSTSSSGRISATEPYIDPATPDRINAYVGNTVILPCFVNNLGQHSVSWVRHRDIHVLTVGRLTFTNDARFLSHHEDGSNEWALSLSSPHENDTGFYECQVNTKPIIMRLIRLQVYEPRAVISGVQELYIKLGSTLALQCRVVNAPSASEFLLWYHNQKVANYGDGRLRINTNHDNNETLSILTVMAASQADSGTYSCNPSNAKDAAVKVHVINGEHPAAMQTNSAFGNRISPAFWIIVSFFLNSLSGSSLRYLGYLSSIVNINVILLYAT